uniref:Uncharacterized protein LOC108053292 n=1 Tax=Drosophila rhopaloa TaxID=1041015 RepID=A0A6P4FPG0_DRORH
MSIRTPEFVLTAVEQNRQSTYTILRTTREAVRNRSDGIKWEDEKAMDRFLASNLERDKLPEDTPLPIYLAHREPRSVSPPSQWDKEMAQEK